MERKEKLRRIYFLRESVKRKWALIPIGLTEDRGVLDCPLCQEYKSPGSLFECKRCPIFDETGRISCHETPYDEVKQMYEDSDYLTNPGLYKTLANEELMFIQYLLEKEKRMLELEDNLE